MNVLISRVQNDPNDIPIKINDLEPIKNELLNSNITNIDPKKIHKIFNWPAYERLLCAYVKYCTHVNQNTDLYERFKLLADIYSPLQQAFSTPKTGEQLTPLVLLLTHTLCSLACLLDNDVNEYEDNYEDGYADGYGNECTKQISSILLRIFNTCRSDSVPNSNRRSILVYLAIQQSRLYFKMRLPASCAMVFANLHTANLFKLSIYPASQRVFLHFYAGKFHLSMNRISAARMHFKYSLDNCYYNSYKNSSIFAIYFAFTCILSGDPPSRSWLQKWLYADELLSPLCISMQSGNLSQWILHTHSPLIEKIFLRMGISIISSVRGELLVLRSLIKNVHEYTGSTDIPFNDIITALKCATDGLNDNNVSAFITSDYNDLFIENICVSLISQGYIKGHIYTRLRLLRVKQFASLESLHPSTNENENWLFV